MKLFWLLVTLLAIVKCCQGKRTEAIDELSLKIAFLAEMMTNLMEELSELKMDKDVDLEKRVEALESQIVDLTETAELKGKKPAINNTNLEERVESLEFQMANVHDDIDTIKTELLNIDTRMTILLDGQLLHDQKLFNLKEETETLESSVTDLQASDFGINVSLNQIDSRLLNLKSKYSKLELNGTVAFHAYLGEYVAIAPGSVVPFQNINVNLGSGFDGDTGQFTVPEGGAGLYHFYVHVVVEGQSSGRFDIRQNGNLKCVAYVSNSHNDGFSCGAVVQLEEGKRIFLLDNFHMQSIFLLNLHAYTSIV